ncbi:MAG: glycosyl transferase family 1 [Alphaproteobacteria bacterium PA2]|nr:MAG: glycosyl transferase family 1 [Alphaproteobacteria bacterium PA2]
MTKRLAIFHPAGRLGLKQNPFGKDVANLQLFQALARHGGYEQLDILSAEGLSGEVLSADLFPQGQPTLRLAGGGLLATDGAAAGGTLLRGQADLAELAWNRRRTVGDRAFSLVGMIHTLAPPALRQEMTSAALAPVQDWDALICTSPSVQSAMTTMFDGLAEHFSERLGAVRSPRPRLPVIPLGVDGGRFAAISQDGAARARLRADLKVPEDEVLVIWVGRLSFFEKAFPQPMFRAVEEAAALCGQKLHFALAGWFPNGEQDHQRYVQAARAYCPSVSVTFVDGNRPDLVADLWAAADVFISLVDNIQETFGITPVEAMAAGLPVVVSDWDGYRFTVRDGQEGFLIPTLGAPPGPLGELLAARHGVGQETYQGYVGAVAAHTAVHVGRAARAISDLASSPDLRRTMGAAGQARVASTFNWPVVVGELNRLFDELAEVRAAAPASPPPRTRLNPVRGDPYADFAHFATHALTVDSLLTLRAGVTGAEVDRAAATELDGMFQKWRAPVAEARTIIAHLQATGSCTAKDLLLLFPTPQRRGILMLLAWMAKLGMVDWMEV